MLFNHFLTVFIAQLSAKDFFLFSFGLGLVNLHTPSFDYENTHVLLPVAVASDGWSCLDPTVVVLVISTHTYIRWCPFERLTAGPRRIIHWSCFKSDWIRDHQGAQVSLFCVKSLFLSPSSSKTPSQQTSSNTTVSRSMKGNEPQRPEQSER